MDTLKVYYPKVYTNQSDYTITDKHTDAHDLEDLYSLYDQIIDTHHDVYSEQLKKDNIIVREGFQNIYFTLKNNHNINFPQEVFFKTYQTSKEAPLIKLNPGPGIESFYRLYAKYTDKYGNKIPYLSKNRVMNFSKKHRRSTCVQFYFLEQSTEKENEQRTSIFVDINHSGQIFVKCNNLRMKDVKQVESSCKDILNNIIQKLIEFIDPNQYIYSFFEEINASNVTIIDLQYDINFKSRQKTMTSTKNKMVPFQCLFQEQKVN